MSNYPDRETIRAYIIAAAERSQKSNKPLAWHLREEFGLKPLVEINDDYLMSQFALHSLEQDNAALRKRLAALEAKLKTPTPPTTKATPKHPNIRPL